MNSPSDLTAEMFAIIERLQPCLTDEQSRVGLLRIAAALPRSLRTVPVGVEIRLAGPKVVDFGATVAPRTTPFRDLIESLRQNTHAVPTPGWSEEKRAIQLTKVLARWDLGVGPLRSVATCAIIEVDNPGGSQPLACPSFFLSAGFRTPQTPHAFGLFRRHPDATVMAVAALTGVWPDPATADAFVHVTSLLPPTADVFAVGAMIGRDARHNLRLLIDGMSVDTIHTILVECGLPRQADVLAPFAVTTGQPRLALEVGPGAERRAGVEVVHGGGWPEPVVGPWPEVLQELVVAGLAEPDRASAAVSLIGEAGETVWGMNHYKVGADDSGLLPGAKIYVGIQHSPDA